MTELSRPPVEAVIFDYDGLLVDTENSWFLACQHTCEPYGVQITEDHRLELMRSHLSEYLIERFGLPATYDEVHASLYGKFEELSEDASLMPGAWAAVDLLHPFYPLAVGTGSRTDQVANSMTRLGLFDSFQAIVGQDRVKHGKPEPDIYLKVAEELSVDPRACVVLEDQPNGMRAAIAAEMRCIVVPNLYLSNPNLRGADLVIPSLGQLTLEMIQGS